MPIVSPIEATAAQFFYFLFAIFPTMHAQVGNHASAARTETGEALPTSKDMRKIPAGATVHNVVLHSGEPRGRIQYACER